jgi:di/tricarboxylate transporter
LLHAIQVVKIDNFDLKSLDQLESEDVGLVEVVLSPRSNLNGKSLQEINFREKFGLSILAIWRAGTSRRSNLREFPLKFGDSLLIFGNRNRIRTLSHEDDFLVLGDELQEAPRHEKAGMATIIMAAVVLSAGFGLLPIAIAAVAGATLMVVTRCINMEEAYSSIHWKAIFLIAGMLPLGIALQNSGSALFLAEKVVSLTIPYGPQALMAGIFMLALLGAQVMPNSVVAVLITPIALNTAVNLGYSPQALAMIVAIGASASFMSPVGHPANVLVMGPGSYRFKDFIKVGFPLTLLIIAATLMLLPKFWPLIP